MAILGSFLSLFSAIGSTLQIENFRMNTEMKKDTFKSQEEEREHREKMLHLTQEYKRRELDVIKRNNIDIENQRFLNNLMLEEFRFRNTLLLEEAKFENNLELESHKSFHKLNEQVSLNSKSRPYIPGNLLKDTGLIYKPYPYIIISTNTNLPNAKILKAEGINPLSKVYKSLKRYNQSNTNFLTILESHEYFSSEQDVLIFFEREIKKPSIIVYAKFEGTVYSVNILYTSIKNVDTDSIIKSDMLSFVSPEHICLWEMDYTDIVKKLQENNKSLEQLTKELENLIETFVGIKLQSYIDQLFEYDLETKYNSQSIHYLTEKLNYYQNNFEKLKNLEQDIVQRNSLFKRTKELGFLSYKEKNHVTLEFHKIPATFASNKIANKWFDKNKKLVTCFKFKYQHASKPYFDSKYIKISNKAGKIGFFDSKGNLIIPFEYDDAHDISLDLVAVKKGDLWGLINTQSQIILSFEFDFLYSPIQGFIKFNSKGLWGLCDCRGTVFTTPAFDSLESLDAYLGTIEKIDMEELYSKIKNDSERKIRELIHEHWLTESLRFIANNHSKLSPKANKNLWGFVNEDGHEVIDYMFLEVTEFSNDIAFGRVSEDEWVMVNVNGDILCESNL